MPNFLQNGNLGYGIAGEDLILVIIRGTPLCTWIVDVVSVHNYFNGFRDDTPSDEEVLRSLALADLKKRNAAELDEKRLQEKLAAGETVTEPQPQDHEKAFYPKYKEYEIIPGEGVNTEDRWKDFKNPYAKHNKWIVI